MSNVTNVILHMGILEDARARIQEVNDLSSLRDGGTGTFLVNANPNDVSGGTKALEATIFLAAFNHLHLGEFMRELKTIAWEHPDELQVIVQEQDDEIFRILTL